jgi:hypothetical protein
MAILAANPGLREMVLQYIGGGFADWPFMPARYVLEAQELLRVALALGGRPPASRMATLAAQAAYFWRRAYQLQNARVSNLVTCLRNLMQGCRARRAPLDRLVRQVQVLLSVYDW